MEIPFLDLNLNYALNYVSFKDDVEQKWIIFFRKGRKLLKLCYIGKIISQNL